MNSRVGVSIQGLQDEYFEWFAKYRWSWFITQKIIAGRPSRKRALAMADQWLRELREAEGSSHFRWVRVLEEGRAGDHIHFHAVVGGFRNRLAYWGRRWEELGGEIQIARFDPEQGGLRYLLKTMRPDGDIDLDFHLGEGAID